MTHSYRNCVHLKPNQTKSWLKLSGFNMSLSPICICVHIGTHREVKKRAWVDGRTRGRHSRRKTDWYKICISFYFPVTYTVCPQGFRSSPSESYLTARHVWISISCPPQSCHLENTVAGYSDKTYGAFLCCCCLWITYPSRGLRY